MTFLHASQYLAARIIAAAPTPPPAPNPDPLGVGLDNSRDTLLKIGALVLAVVGIGIIWAAYGAGKISKVFGQLAVALIGLSVIAVALSMYNGNTDLAEKVANFLGLT